MYHTQFYVINLVCHFIMWIQGAGDTWIDTFQTRVQSCVLDCDKLTRFSRSSHEKRKKRNSPLNIHVLDNIGKFSNVNVKPAYIYIYRISHSDQLLK